MLLSEIKMLGIYFASKNKAEYLITEELIEEYQKKKPLLEKNLEI
jgi:hypothetical protein